MLVLCTTAHAADRVALVIDVSSYRHLGKLANPGNDGAAVAEALSARGFDVVRVSDPDQSEFLGALEAFARQSVTADVALVYFAGHGLEVEGRNYLLPVDAEIRAAPDIESSGVPVSRMLASVEQARKLRIVILDSCRDNPFPGIAGIGAFSSAPRSDTLSHHRQAPEGKAGRGTLVAYAAKDGAPALDGAGSNSPFARALVQHLGGQGVEIGMLFRLVRDSVLDWTGGQQEPHTYGSLSSTPLFLDGGEAAAAPDGRLAWSVARPELEQQLLALESTGDVRAMLGLAYMRLAPGSNRFAPQEAAKHFQRAADHGSAEARYELGRLYEQGVGVEQDQAKAVELYLLAAKDGFPDAANDLGVLYFSGGVSTPKDVGKALAYLKQAADLGQPHAMFNYAAMIDDGGIDGAGPDDAASYIFQALRKGSEDVLNMLVTEPNMFKPNTLRALQERLAANDLYEGRIDGVIGGGSIRGIRKAYGIED